MGSETKQKLYWGPVDGVGGGLLTLGKSGISHGRVRAVLWMLV